MKTYLHTARHSHTAIYHDLKRLNTANQPKINTTEIP